MSGGTATGLPSTAYVGPEVSSAPAPWTTLALVEAADRLYRSLFAAAVGFAWSTAAWGLVIAPFNDFQDHIERSIALGLVLSALGAIAFAKRGELFAQLNTEQRWVLAVALLGVGVLWADGGWRSSYYLFSYSAIALAAVVGGLRWSLACGVILAVGYLSGLAVNGYTWSELRQLRDADSVVANTGGYLIAAYFFAARGSRRTRSRERSHGRPLMRRSLARFCGPNCAFMPIDSRRASDFTSRRPWDWVPR